jgi:hypothetical protein
MEFTLEIWSSNEFISAPPLMRVSLDEATVARITEMQRVAIDHDLDSVSVRSYLPEYGYANEAGEFESVEARQATDPSAEGWRTECNKMTVTREGSVYWECNEKYSEALLVSDWLSIQEITAGANPAQGLVPTPVRPTVN